MHIKTRIGSLGLPARLLGFAMAAFITFAVVALAFWFWTEPSPWVAVLMLVLQILAIVAVAKILIERFPIRVHGIQGKPEELTQADWDELRAKRRQRRRLALRLISTVSIVLAIVLLWGQGPWGKILSVPSAYLYYWALYSRSKVTSPYPGLSLERVGADIGEPVSVSPARLGWFSIALTWIRGEFPAKPVGGETMPKFLFRKITRPKFLFRKIWAALPLPTVPILLIATKTGLPFLFYILVGTVGISFWLWWAGLGWPAIKYTLGAGEDPDVFISRPKLHLEGMEVQTLYNRAALFNMGITETRRGGAVHWDPAVMAVAGLAKEPMNLPWCLEWFMRRIIEVRGKQQ